MSTSLGILALGLFVGGMSGVLGIGGGVFLIPGLMYVFRFSQQKAQGTTLAALVPPIGLAAAMQYYKQGYVDVRAAAMIAIGFAAGAYISAGYVKDIPAVALSQIFGCLLLFIGVRLVLMSDRQSAIPLGAVIAVVGAWVAFLFLRSVGKRYNVRPYYRDAIRERATDSPASADYQI